MPKKKGSKFAFKLLLVGEPECGKTSLIKRYVDNFFEEGYQITLGVDFLSKTIELEGDDGQKQELVYQLWDIAGQSGFTNFRHLYLKKAQGVFLVFDLSRPDETFDKLDRWREDVQEASPNAKIIVIGNKEDLVDPDNLPVSEEEAIEKLKAHGFITTSAKTGSRVEKAFVQMGKLILGK